MKFHKKHRQILKKQLFSYFKKIQEVNFGNKKRAKAKNIFFQKTKIIFFQKTKIIFFQKIKK